ncbi:DUF2007 domain-containing protein [Undibacterium cyanobacteriorum]|uniref:DUF2007 domain-containing protein n=1 Tax=Undibacterium cyanobacteriorum TaxID=3073561 RepID=A0ABY9RKI6_9BURK|nr:DUF2007 domain-containing protein [Undibacterium sp. 20NA77.5]WMW81466.1 DUF2007 domain-containing protein [Undibacterium sp. 20NA77.5]
MSNLKKVYDASNPIEAHMLCDLLTQQGIQAFIEGEHLQGGIGDLPAMGLVRVVVGEEQFAEAIKLVAEWEAQQTSSFDGRVHTAPEPMKRFGGMSLFFMGFGLGLLMMYAYFFFPFYRDHRSDEHWTYNLSGKATQASFDRNFDGKIDLKQSYGADGAIERSESDDDFDGVFETITSYRDNNPELTEIDTDHDGFHDQKWRFRFGVLTESEVIYPTTGLPRKHCAYQLGLLRQCELDSDLDGKMDTRIEYDALGEEKKREKL